MVFLDLDEEDKIQVLGTPQHEQDNDDSAPQHKPRGNGRFVRFGMIVLCVMLLLGGLAWFVCDREESEVEEEIQEIEQPVVVPVDPLPSSAASVVLSVDSINDVKIRIYALNGLSAGLSFDLPDKGDTTVLLAVQAADIRRDNGGIVGDFVLRGERLARGKRKSGYCALLDRKVLLGAATDDEAMERCIRQKGDFFRQYPLVINGEIQENRLKGKALRRALARQGETLCFVESCNRESVYDFAEALADFGFSEALYLVGGNSYGWWRESNNAVHEFGQPITGASYPNLNYIVFRSSGIPSE